MKPTPLAHALTSVLTCSLLAACGGGGGGSTVRNNPPPTSLPQPPAAAGPCLPPLSGDCVVTVAATMRGGRDSPFALRVRTPRAESLVLGPETPGARYVFSGGTTVESGVLWVRLDNTLASNVEVLTGAMFLLDASLEGNLVSHGNTNISFRSNLRGNVVNTGNAESYGRITGSVTNSGSMALNGRVDGNVANSGRVLVDGIAYQDQAFRAINGNFSQTANGAFVFGLAPDLMAYKPAPLQITGQAQLNGKLEISQYSDDFGPYPLSAAGTYHVLHAGGGVLGQFAQWTSSSGLFIQGDVRYGSNDVWFDLTRISLATAMASNGIGSALTLASATTLDRLFVRTDGFALTAPGSLGDAQRRVLASAGSVLRVEDLAQATRTLDSLSGAAHRDALQASLRQGIANPGVSQRLATMQPGFVTGAWSRTDASGGVSGFDHWLSPRLLVGVQAGQSSETTRDTFGRSTRLSPQAGAYLRWFGDDGWYAGGSAGYAQHTLALDRTIDLDRGGHWNAHARHRFNVAGVRGEAGRRLPLAGGTLSPYVALDATALRSERTIEQGGTGFELALQPAMQAQLGAGLGVRYGRDWRLGDTGWLRLEADARVQRRLVDAGDPLRAAYVGVPDLWFDVPGNTPARSSWLDVGLRGGYGHTWRWSFDLTQPWAGTSGGLTAYFGVQRSF